MGLFGLFKKDEKKVLSRPEKYSGGFIQPLTTGQVEISLGEKLVVNEGWCAVIVVKDKPQDVFSAGEYELTIPCLPKTTRALKLDKSKVIKKKGKQEVVFKNSFKCDLYFVNMSAFTGQDWEIPRITKRNKQNGRFTMSVNGKCDFQSTNAGNTIRLFLLEWDKINAGKAQPRLQAYISEFAGSSLEWSRENNPDILKDKTQVASIISEGVSKNLDKYGIKVTNFVVDEITFDRNITAILEQQKRDATSSVEAEDKASEILNNIDLDEPAEKEMVTVEVKHSANQKENAVPDKVVLKSNENDEEQEQKSNNFKITIKEEPEPIDFTRVTDEELLKNDFVENKKEEIEENNTKTSKICPNCGKVHNLDDQICECGCILD